MPSYISIFLTFVSFIFPIFVIIKIINDVVKPLLTIADKFSIN